MKISDILKLCNSLHIQAMRLADEWDSQLDRIRTISNNDMLVKEAEKTALKLSESSVNESLYVVRIVADEVCKRLLRGEEPTIIIGWLEECREERNAEKGGAGGNSSGRIK